MEDDPVAFFRKKLIQDVAIRYYKALNYLTFFIYVLFVSICALLADYALVAVLEFVVRKDIAKYPVVAEAFDWYKIGSAVLVFFVALIHSFMSAYSQLKFEIESMNDE